MNLFLAFLFFFFPISIFSNLALSIHFLRIQVCLQNSVCKETSYPIIHGNHREHFFFGLSSP